MAACIRRRPITHPLSGVPAAAWRQVALEHRGLRLFDLHQEAADPRRHRPSNNTIQARVPLTLPTPTNLGRHPDVAKTADQ